MENSAHFVSKIELLLTMLSNFEKGGAFKHGCLMLFDGYLFHPYKVLLSVYSMITDLICLFWHMLLYIQYCSVWFSRAGRDRETEEEDNKDFELRFQVMFRQLMFWDLAR